MYVYGFPEYLVLWTRLELSALPGKLERNRGGEAMNRAEKLGPMGRISTIQAISLLDNFGTGLADLLILGDGSLRVKPFQDQSAGA